MAKERFEQLLEYTRKGRDSLRNEGNSSYFSHAVDILEEKDGGKKYAEQISKNPFMLSQYRQLAVAEQTDIKEEAGQYAEDVEQAYQQTANQLVEKLEAQIE